MRALQCPYSEAHLVFGCQDNLVSAENQASNRRHAIREHVQLLSGTARQVNYASAHEWAAVVDLDYARGAGLAVHDQKLGAERQTAVSCCQLVLIKSMPV